jgi:hypothetical protein
VTRFPEQHFSVAVLCNYAETDPSSPAHLVVDIYLATDLKVLEPSAAAPGVGISLTEQQLSGLQGLYWNRDDGQFMKTYVKDGKLRISFDIEDDYALKPVSETFCHIADTLWGDEANVRFEPSAGVKPRRLLRSFGDKKSDLFDSFPG